MAVTAAQLEHAGIVAIVRAHEAVDFDAVADAIAAGGIRAMEITLNTPGALAGIRRLRERGPIELSIGAGTILERDDAAAAMDAGAEFVVTPTLQTDTVQHCRIAGVPIFCGCLTPTEALAAHRAGADFIKLFPADTLGPAYMRALLAPLPFLKVAPTGGVTLDNLASWFDAGCSAVAIGSGLLGSDLLSRRDWTALRQSAAKFTSRLCEIRGS